MMLQPTHNKDFAPDLADFFRHCTTASYPQAAVMIRPGDPANTLYYLKAGRVTISMTSETGEEFILSHCGPGEFLGEIGYFAPIDSRMVTVRAREASETLEISYTKLRSLASAQQIGCYAQLVEQLAKQMANRLMLSAHKTSTMVFLSVAGRVRAAIAEMLLHLDPKPHADGVEIAITQDEISRMVGCSREMVNRVLKSLQKEGAVSANAKSLIVRQAFLAVLPT